MMTPDHPNARFLLDLYGSASSEHAALQEQDPEAAAAFVRTLTQKFSPDWVIHTAGHRHRSIGGIQHGMEVTARRRELSGGSFVVHVDWAMADDVWAATHSLVTGENARGEKLDVESLGMWRFQDGSPVEHWELVSDPEAWDSFWDE